MTRKYGPALRERVSAVDVDAPETELGDILAKLSVDKDAPMFVIAKAVGVSRMTVHSWFRGLRVSPRRAPDVRRVIDLLRARESAFSTPTDALEYLVPDTPRPQQLEIKFDDVI